MARLGDLVGTLLADVAAARVRADWEAVKLAEAYAAHDLLRHMPIPRFRLPEVRVDLPVVMEEVPASRGEIYGKPTAGELSGMVRTALAQAGVRPSAAQRRSVYTAVRRQVAAAFETGPQVLLSSRRLADQVERTASDRLKPVFEELGINPEQQARVAAEIRRRTSNLFVGKLLQAEGLQVRTASTAVREFAGSDAVMRVQLSISEDAMEMSINDEDALRLVPE